MITKNPISQSEIVCYLEENQLDKIYDILINDISKDGLKGLINKIEVIDDKMAAKWRETNENRYIQHDFFSDMYTIKTQEVFPHIYDKLYSNKTNNYYKNNSNNNDGEYDDKNVNNNFITLSELSEKFQKGINPISLENMKLIEAFHNIK